MTPLVYKVRAATNFGDYGALRINETPQTEVAA